jgi:hypothetical protein
MRNLERKNLDLKIEEIQSLTEEEVEWDLINHSTSGVYVKSTVKEIDPHSETISDFTRKHYMGIRPTKKINPLADSKSAPMWIFDFERDGRTFRVAKTMSVCSLLQQEVYDWDNKKLLIGFFVVGIPMAEGTTVQTDLDDIEWTIPIFAAQVCAEFANHLAEGECIHRGTIH